LRFLLFLLSRSNRFRTLNPFFVVCGGACFPALALVSRGRFPMLARRLQAGLLVPLRKFDTDPPRLTVLREENASSNLPPAGGIPIFARQVSRLDKPRSGT